MFLAFFYAPVQPPYKAPKNFRENGLVPEARKNHCNNNNIQHKSDSDSFLFFSNRKKPLANTKKLHQYLNLQTHSRLRASNYSRHGANQFHRSISIHAPHVRPCQAKTDPNCSTQRLNPSNQFHQQHRSVFAALTHTGPVKGQ